jgi:hypothetical protein
MNVLTIFLGFNIGGYFNHFMLILAGDYFFLTSIVGYSNPHQKVVFPRKFEKKNYRPCLKLFKSFLLQWTEQVVCPNNLLSKLVLSFKIGFERKDSFFRI